MNEMIERCWIDAISEDTSRIMVDWSYNGVDELYDYDPRQEMFNADDFVGATRIEAYELIKKKVKGLSRKKHYPLWKGGH